VGLLTADYQLPISDWRLAIKPIGSSDLLGPRASRPQRAAGALVLGLFRNVFSRFAPIAGGTPAVPANHLISNSWLYEQAQEHRMKFNAQAE
jgi:hypothetical protein